MNDLTEQHPLSPWRGSVSFMLISACKITVQEYLLSVAAVADSFFLFLFFPYFGDVDYSISVSLIPWRDFMYISCALHALCFLQDDLFSCIVVPGKFLPDLIVSARPLLQVFYDITPFLFDSRMPCQATTNRFLWVKLWWTNIKICLSWVSWSINYFSKF